jgi:uncharacterized protein YdhG (YjbR/CyaY superfamily)
MKQPNSPIDDYIAGFPAEIRERLQAVCSAIRAVLPDAQEKISYQMPTFYQRGNIIHFAAAKAHIGIYPAASGIAAFATEFDRLGLRYSKGAVQLPNNQPLPLDLVTRLARFRLEENLAQGRPAAR